MAGRLGPGVGGRVGGGAARGAGFAVGGACVVRGSMYVCRKVKNSQARTGHQRGMGGRGTDDDDTHERHTHKQAHKTHSQLAATHPELAYT